MGEGEVPGLIKVLAVLYYIGMGAIILFGLFGIMFMGLISSMFSLPFDSSIFLVIFELLILGLAILYFFIARSLWKGKNWARIMAIILSILGMLGLAYYIISTAITNTNAIKLYGESFKDTFYISSSTIVEVVIGVLISGFIAGYLLFNKKVKEAFAGNHKTKEEI